MKINVTKPYLPPYEEYIYEIKSLWDSCWLTNFGEKHELLVEALRSKSNVKYINLFTNGHQALESAIKAFSLKGSVITTPFTFVSTTSAIVNCGLKPIFCDVKEDDYTIDPSKIEQLITEDTSAIIATHVYGNICDHDKIHAIAKKYDLKVIYDAAHAFNEKVDDKYIYDLGDASMVSFHATKVFHTIEGGAIYTNNKEVSEKLKLISSFGLQGEDVIIHSGNSKMNEFQAAMGLCNLRYLKNVIENRKLAYNHYSNRLSSLEEITINKYCENLERNYSYYPIFVKGGASKREELVAFLKKNGVNARLYFYPLTSKFTIFEEYYRETPTALKLSENVLCLPLYADLSLEDVDRVVDLVIEFFG